MAGRPKIFDEQQVIDKAVEIFWNKGYEAATADELLASMGIGKGSFYLSFKGGKKELYEKSLIQFFDNYYKNLKSDITMSDDPIAFIKNFFLDSADVSEIKQAQGCYIGNGLIEMSTKDGHTKEIASRLLKRMEGIFTEAIEEAQNANKLKTTEKPEVLGRYLLNLWNGINVTRRMYPKDESLKKSIALNLKLIY